MVTLFLQNVNKKQIELITKMVCEKCEAKLSKVSAPNPWRTSTAPAGGRKINENKALSSARERYNPIGTALPPCR